MAAVNLRSDVTWALLLGACAFAASLLLFVLYSVYLVTFETGPYGHATINGDIWRTVVGTGFAVAAGVVIFVFVALRWVAPARPSTAP